MRYMQFGEVVCSQNSIVKSLVPKLPAVAPKSTSASVPLKLKAIPTLPSAYVAAPKSVPLLVPTTSWAFSSPGHQFNKPEGTGVHGGGGFTVSIAFVLLVEPNALLTCTAY